MDKSKAEIEKEDAAIKSEEILAEGIEAHSSGLVAPSVLLADILFSPEDTVVW